MTWAQVARKDFEDSIRSRMLWAAMAAFVLLMGIVVGAAATGDLSEADPTNLIVVFSQLGGQLLVPIVALMIGYMAIVGERESGSLRVLFGLSHSRSDVFAGKFVSRLGVIGVAALVACGVAIALAVLLFGSIDAGTFLGFVAVTLLLGAAFTSIAVCVSAMTASRAQAMAGAIGAYVLFIMLWHPIVAGLHYALNGELVGVEGPAWYFLLLRFNPLTAYVHTTGSLADQFINGLIGWETIVEDVALSQLQQPDALLLSNRVSGDLPYYLSDWSAGLILLAWVVVPAAVGYWRFEAADLN